MKVVCLLLCVTLAREIAGSVFYRANQPTSINQQRVDDYYRSRNQVPFNPRFPVPDPASSSSESMENVSQYNMQYSRNPSNGNNYIHYPVPQKYRRHVEEQTHVVRFADPKPGYKTKRTVKNLVNGHTTPLFGDANVSASMALNAMDLSGDVVQWKDIKYAAGDNQEMKKKDIAQIYRSALQAHEHITPEEKPMIEGPLDAAIQQSQGNVVNATEMLKRNQYPVEEHIVKTEDGYFLTMFRIPPRNSNRNGKSGQVVFLMHDILGSADDFLLRGPKQSLAYFLADAGYDVYLGNARSSKYSDHVSQHRALPSYWQFSNDEIAYFDLPAMINYALLNSNQEKMYYIGHGVGTTVFFALAAKQPEFNQKVIMMYAMSPMVYLQHARSPMLRLLGESSPIKQRLSKLVGYGEFRPNSELVLTLGGDLCEGEVNSKHLCSNAYVAFSGINLRHMNYMDVAAIITHLPAGASVKQLQQLSQGYDSHNFGMFDYGADMNVKVYGTNSPPSYNMKNVAVPVGLYYSEHDWLAHPKDVLRLKKELPNVVEDYQVPVSYYSHMDFQYSNEASDVVYSKILKSMNKMSINMIPITGY